MTAPPAQPTATPATAPIPDTPDSEADAVPHSLLDDAQALLTGTLFIAFGVALIRHAGLLTGGTAGLAFLGHYLTGWRFGVLFFLLNLPFYWLAWRSLGQRFTIKTFIAVGLLSLMTEALPSVIELGPVHPAFAGGMGGLLIGTGLLMLVRHRASLGGVGILALVLQERHGIRAGKFQMAVDCAIVLASCWIVSPVQVAASVLGAVALNFILAVNHRPGRYVGM